MGKFFRNPVLLPAAIFGCFFLSATFFAGCTEENKSITYDGPDKLRFSDAGGSQTVTFEASEIWTVSVANTGTTKDQDWVVIDGNSGEAGTNTLEITVNPNTAEEERTAALTVFCGGDVLVVAVVQSAAGQGSGTGEDNPQKEALISKISITDSDDYKEVYDFEYNNDLVSKISVTSFYKGIKEEDESSVHTFNWGKDKVNITSEYWGDGKTETNRMTIDLDAQGRAVKYEQPYDNFNFIMKMSYNSDGTLMEVNSNSDGESTGYFWSGGNLTTVKSYGGTGTIKYSEHKNNANLDLNWFFYSDVSGGDLTVLGLLNLLGERSVNYSVPVPWSDYSEPDVVSPIPEDGEYTYDNTETLKALDEIEANYKIIDGKLKNAESSVPFYSVVYTYKVYRKITNYDQYMEGPGGKKLYYTYEETVISKTEKSRELKGSDTILFEIEY